MRQSEFSDAIITGHSRVKQGVHDFSQEMFVGILLGGAPARFPQSSTSENQLIAGCSGFTWREPLPPTLKPVKSL